MISNRKSLRVKQLTPQNFHRTTDIILYDAINLYLKSLGSKTKFGFDPLCDTAKSNLESKFFDRNQPFFFSSFTGKLSTFEFICYFPLFSGQHRLSHHHDIWYGVQRIEKKNSKAFEKQKSNVEVFEIDIDEKNHNIECVIATTILLNYHSLYSHMFVYTIPNKKPFKVTGFAMNFFCFDIHFVGTRHCLWHI